MNNSFHDFTNFLQSKKIQCIQQFHEIFVKLKITYRTQCGNCRYSLSHFFGKNFVKATVLLKKLLNRWFDEIFFSERISRFSTLCRIECIECFDEIFAEHKMQGVRWFHENFARHRNEAEKRLKVALFSRNFLSFLLIYFFEEKHFQ